MSGIAVVDCSKETGCVARCRACPYWFAFRDSREAAWRAIREHEERAHPGSHQATNALMGYKRTS